MKVLFFNYEYPPLGGGAGNASFYMLREYAKIPGLEVDFVTSSIDSQYHQEKVGENITVHRLPIGKNESNVHYQTKGELIKYTWSAYRFSHKLLKQNKYDLTHSFFSVPCGFVSLLLKFEYKLPYIISLRGSDVPYYSERFTFLYKFITPIIRFIWNHAAFVISNSKGLKELALKSEPNKEIGIIFNGIDTDEFFPDTQMREAGQFRILCVSRVTPRKGIRFLIQAFHVLVGRYPQIRLVVAGDGNEKKSLEELVRSLGIEDKVVFLGVVPHEKVSLQYRQADVFVLPSLNEGMSNTMLEAIASGLPIIATDVGGTRELLDEGKNGFIVRLKDYDDIAEKIEYLLQNPEIKEKMGKESREHAERMSWREVAIQYVNLYSEITNLVKMKK